MFVGFVAHFGVVRARSNFLMFAADVLVTIPVTTV
jgi:hypothetical protein